MSYIYESAPFTLSSWYPCAWNKKKQKTNMQLSLLLKYIRGYKFGKATNFADPKQG